MKTFACFLILALLAVPNAQADDKVIIHEWGTFTCLQDERGQAIGGINVDDEPVPYFVSSVAVGVAPQYNSGFGFPNLGLPPYEQGKGWVSGDPHVTMRLETPVIYFYPPKGQPASSVPPLDVHVDFHGGVLSQFYPHAAFSGLPKLRFPGLPQDNIFPYVDQAMGINEATLTSLDWKAVQLGSNEKPIECDDQVWTTPRETGASVLQVKFFEPEFDKPGEKKEYTQAEHFLFYRGVGHLESPVTIQYLPEFGGKLTLIGRLADTSDNPDFVDHLKSGWAVQINTKGQCAFNAWPGGDIAVVSLGMGCYMPPISGEFTPASFSADNLAKLKSSMHDALVKAGLYDDEATAMLKTWELSYFKSPGLRFFYLVPRAWVDKVLPLKIIGPATDITRVMVGRIELITDAQKAALAHLSAGPCPDLAALKKAALEALNKASLSLKEREPYYTGDKPLSDLGLTIPPLVQDYLSLGRFRDALIVREQQLHPSAALAQFIKDNRLAEQ